MEIIFKQEKVESVQDGLGLVKGKEYDFTATCTAGAAPTMESVTIGRVVVSAAGSGLPTVLGGEDERAVIGVTDLDKFFPKEDGEKWSDIIREWVQKEYIARVPSHQPVNLPPVV